MEKIFNKSLTIQKISIIKVLSIEIYQLALWYKKWAIIILPKNK